MPSILALDLSSTTGWAFGDPASHRPVIYGEWSLKRGGEVHIGAAMAALSDALRPVLEVHRPDWILAEAPLNLHSIRGQRAAEMAFGLAGLVDMIGFRWSIRTRSARVDDVRMAELGRCRFSGGRDEAKRTVLAWAKAAGYRTHSDNVADALVLWRHGCRVLLKQPQTVPGYPLIRAAPAPRARDRRQLALT